MWKTIKGFSKYAASSEGTIKRLDTGKILRGRPLPHGYFRVYLTDDNGKRHDVLIHRVICLTFNGEPPEGFNCVNHIDCNKINNQANNLEWCNHKQNMVHASKNKLLVSQSQHLRKVNKKRRKAVKAVDQYGNVIMRFPRIEDARNAGYSSVSHSLKHNLFTKKGFKWVLE